MLSGRFPTLDTGDDEYLASGYEREFDCLRVAVYEHHARGVGRELELRVRVNVCYKFDPNFARQVGCFFDNGCRSVRATAKAGDFAEHTVKRGQQKHTKGETACGEDQ